MLRQLHIRAASHRRSHLSETKLFLVLRRRVFFLLARAFLLSRLYLTQLEHLAIVCCTAFTALPGRLFAVAQMSVGVVIDV